MDKDIPGFLRAIARGDHAGAWRIIYRENLFPGVLGWICPHPCESACRLAPEGAAIPVCDLKRWVTTSHLPPPDLTPEPANGGPAVAIVGAGPAGLAAAHDLAAAGAQVTLLDREDHPGGLLTDCIPAFRLPPTVVEDDIRRILALGVEFRGGFELEEPDQLLELRARGYAAILLALGAGADVDPRIPGWRSGPYARTAIRFLRDAARDRLALDDLRVAVVGGGNGAFDVARMAQRLGAREVQVLYRRGRESLPAFPRDIERAEAEGIFLRFHTLVEGLEWSADTLAGVFSARARESASPGRSAPPQRVPGSERLEPFDMIVFAIGQQRETSPESFPLPGVFTTDDPRARSGTVVDAIASGRRGAATVVDALTTTGHWLPAPDGSVVPFPPRRVRARRNGRPSRDGDALPAPMPGEVAIGEAGRCLGCDRFLVLEADACILCGRCATACAHDALAWRPASNRTWQLVIDDDACRRCGDCVAGCPTRALEWRSWRRPNRFRPQIPIASPGVTSSDVSGGRV